MSETLAAHITTALDLIAKKTLEDETAIGAAFPYVTHPDGSWDTMSVSVSAGYSGENWSHGNWFCGFWVGMLLTGYLHTGDEKYLKLAADRMTLVEERANDGNTHDLLQGRVSKPRAMSARTTLACASADSKSAR